jgi:hypothetical protein
MKVRYSTFLNNEYYEQFLVLYKSFILYEHKHPFRVYSWSLLDEDKKQNLRDIGVEVVDVVQGDWSFTTYFSLYGFKWKGLLESDCDVEVLLDADTLFLDNLDDLIDAYTDHELVVVPEHVSWGRVGNLFNIGLMVCGKKSKHLLEKSVQRMIDLPYKKNNAPNTEMFSLCDIVQEYKVNVLELDYKQYMHLWENHKFKKNLSIENGKFVVRNEDGSRVRFYHFTTHIDPYQGSNVLRFSYDSKTTNRMWVKRFNNPVGLIYNHLDINEDFNTIKESQESWSIK